MSVLWHPQDDDYIDGLDPADRAAAYIFAARAVAIWILAAIAVFAIVAAFVLWTN